MKYFVTLLFVFSSLFSANFLSKDLEQLLDTKEISQKQEYTIQPILEDKMTYQEFIDYRWKNNIELGESWGTEIAYHFYLLDTNKDVEKIEKMIKTSYKHLNSDNFLEIRKQIDLNYEKELLTPDEKNSLLSAYSFAEVKSKMSAAAGGGSDSGDGGNGGDGGDGDGD